MLVVAALGHVLDRTDDAEMRLRDRVEAVADAAVRATLATVDTIGQATVCGFDNERLSHALFAATAAINALSNSDRAVQTLTQDVLAAGMTRQRNGRGAPCAEVDSGLRATEQAFAKRGLL